MLEAAKAGAGCESRQAIGLITFAGMLVATVVGIAFPPAYFSMFSRKVQEKHISCPLWL